MRRSGFRTITALMLILLVSLHAAAQQNARELFERARLLDESNQNLSEAIRLYSQVVRRANDQRALAARAQYRIGVINERLGRKAEAQRAFQAVVNQYADQAELARRARAKLPAVTANATARRKGAASAPARWASNVTVRQVWAGPTVDFFGVPTADGRYLPVTNWETGDLGIRDLESGQTRRLTNKGSWMQSAEFALFPRLSPDGKQVAYNWYTKELAFEYRVIGTDGSAPPRVLYKGTAVDDAFVMTGGWTPDGKHLAVAVIKASKSETKPRPPVVEMGFMSAADGSFRVLKTFSDLDGPQLSPDGRYIAYSTRQNPNDTNISFITKESDIFIFDVETRQEIPVVQHPAGDFAPVWSPDGKHILFVSDRTGTLGFWLQAVANGKPKGAPELVKTDVGRVWPMGFTRNGSFYYGLDTGMNDVYVASLDLKAGKVVEGPAPLSQRFVGSNSSPAWSPDGKYVAYISQRGPGTPNLGSRDRVLVVRSLDTGQEREVPVNLSVIGRLRWFAPRTIIANGQDKQPRYGIFRIDPETGAVTTLIQEEGNNYRFPELAPDGKTLYYQQINFPTRTWSIRARNLESGEERELYSVKSPANTIQSIGLSPDWRQLAFTLTDSAKPRHVSLRVMPTGGGEAREIYQIPTPTPARLDRTRLIWTPDGQKILFVRGPQEPPKPQDDTFELWQVSVADGKAQRLGLAMELMRDINLHPDGRRLAFAAGQNKNEVWVMENFLPPAQNRKTSASRR